MESVILHEKWELVSVYNVDLCIKSEMINYPWIIFTYTKQFFLWIDITTLHEKLIILYIDSFFKIS